MIYMPSWSGKYFWVNFDLVKHAERPYNILNSSFFPFKSNFTELKKSGYKKQINVQLNPDVRMKKNWIFFTF